MKSHQSPGSLLDLTLNPNRRQFLKVMGASAAVTALPSLGYADTTNYDDGNRQIPGGLVDVGNAGNHVIVIGAGFAGLAAANSLSNEGVQVTLLEARSRLGGRAHTAEVGYASVDLGCSLIHNTSTQNPITKLNKQIGGTTIAAGDNNNANITVYDREIDVDFPIEETAVLLGHAGAFDEALSDLAASLGPGASVADGIDAYMASISETPDRERRIREVLEFIHGADAPDDTDKIDLNLWVNAPYSQYNGLPQSDVIPTGGYTLLINALSNGINTGSCLIKYEEVVSSISYDAYGVTVTCTDKHQATQTYSGSHVIVSAPLGVLKAGDIAFNPPLDPVKQNAIDALGWGSLEKAVVRFDTPFWQGSNSHRFVIPEVSPSGQQNYRFWQDFSAFYPGAPVLVSRFEGSFAEQVVSGNPNQAQNNVEAILSDAYGPLPPIQEFILTNWTNDPYTKGSYSYFALGNDGDEMNELSEPVAGRVMFAGEATFALRHATADGAFASGVREAKRVLGARKVNIVA